MPRDPWLPQDFTPPTRVDLPTGHHLRPIRADDAEIDLPAVLATRERLWAAYGEAWGWPPEHLDLDLDRADLAHHEEEAGRREAFDYAMLNADESELLGCCYESATRVGADAEISWWVREEYVGTDVESAIDAFLPAWIATSWPMTAPAYPGRDLSWRDYLARPRHPA